MERDTVIKTYSIDKEIAEKFTEQTPDQKTSQELENLMAEYIDEDLEERKQPIKLLDPNVVTQARQKLVKQLIEQDLFGKKKATVLNKMKSAGAYTGDSGKYHFKNAVKFLSKLDDAPITTEKGKIVAEPFECRDEECEANLTLPGVAKNEMKCPKCGRKYEV
jgi:hypothetical protein